MLHVSLHAEPVFQAFGHYITNSTLTGWIVTLLLLVFGGVIGHSLKLVPSLLQSAVELIYEGFSTTAYSVIGNPEAANASIPFALTLFFYILFSNFVGLLPGVSTIFLKAGEIPLFRAPTSDLNTTLCLALLTMGFVQYMGIKHLGGRHYLGKFFTLKSPLDFLVGIQEFISELTRIISFSFRLFGNIFAGEMIIAVITYLTSTYLPIIFFFPLPFYVLEAGFAVIQAFVFAFLMIVFTGLAVTPHGDHSKELATA